VGQYWNDPGGTHAFPGTAPLLTETDPNVSFSWGSNSPDPGLITTTNFLAKWTGYFVAPQNGTYQFGATSLDGVRIYINGSLSLDSWTADPTSAYGTAVTLTAGQIVPIEYDYDAWTGASHSTQLLVKTADGAINGPMNPIWLQTGVKPIATPHGLYGQYYTDDGTHTFDAANLANGFLSRTDTSMSLNWGTGSPVPNGPKDKYIVKWVGYFTAPEAVTDSYTFGAAADDGVRIFVNGTKVLDAWSDHSASPILYGSPIPLTAGQQVPIEIDYYKDSHSADLGSAQLAVYMKEANLPPSQPDTIVSSSLLSPQAEVLPDGWSLGLDPDGNLSYNFAVITPGSVVLYDSAGMTHTYAFANGGYTPPVNETGQMVRNGDGTITLQDSDGRTYVFNPDGTVKSTTTSADDLNPAALLYTYGTTTGSSVPHLTQIADPVNSSRWMKIYYGSDSNCPAVPAGFSPVPSNMICAFTTSDGNTTQLGYSAAGQIARVIKPGADYTDYQYDALGRIASMRDDLANDAIAAGVRTQDSSVLTQVAYDPLGHVSSVTLPAATAGATQLAHSYSYFGGYTQLHVANATEPNGFTREIKYDGTDRTTHDIDVANLDTQTTWDPAKDLIQHAIAPTGLETTHLYDFAERETDTYGPAPSTWFDNTSTDPAYDTPLAADVSQVPHTQDAYDGGIHGLAAAYYNVATASNGTGGSTRVLSGNPSLHGTGIGNVNGDVNQTWNATQPFTPSSGDGWGLSLTGYINLASTGTYAFRAFSDDGVRLWIDDALVIDDWNDGAQRSHSMVSGYAGFSNTTANSWHRVRLDYYNEPGATNAMLQLFMTPPGGTETSSLGSLLTPNYGLKTSETTYDSSTSVGNTTTTYNYGSRPELGLLQSSTVDPSGLSLTTSYTYESPGATGSFLRKLSQTLPGGAATTYTYYGANETRQNPCNTSQTFQQAGMLKITTGPDPDGSGPETGITTENVYDNAGRVVATRENSDNWTCYTYDARGRETQEAVPVNADGPARTITFNYAVSGNPLVTSIGDSSGTLQTTVDLLGRTVGYEDSMSNTFTSGQTVTSYDNLGRITTVTSPELGTEKYTYDSFNRLQTQILDNTTYATVGYDSFGRPSQVTYPAAGQLKLAVGYDNLGNTANDTYTLGNGTAGPADSLAYSQSGKVISGTELSQSKSFTYDKYGRLTSASLFGSTYAYTFGTPAGCTGTYNPNAGKDSNRTSQTVNGATTTYCYDYADRLVSSSDPSLDSDTYDQYGNMTELGGWSNTSNDEFAYDSTNRIDMIRQYAGGPVEIQYYRDAADRVVYRGAFGSAEGSSNEYFGYTDSSDSPSYLLSTSTALIERYIRLPGNVLLTVRSGTTRVYSLPDVQGSVMATVNQTGGSLATFKNGPFGEPISTTAPGNVNGNASYDWQGAAQRLNEPKFTNTITEMGARAYIPVIGRFSSPDPVANGNANAYVYPQDPINSNDLTGKCRSGFGWICKGGRLVRRSAHAVSAVSLRAFYGLGSVTRNVISSPGFLGALRGCSNGVVFSRSIAIATLAATGQAEVSAGELALSCAVGGLAGFLNAEREGSGDGLENTNRAYEMYNALNEHM
jgi:RHS repeat-associated protein